MKSVGVKMLVFCSAYCWDTSFDQPSFSWTSMLSKNINTTLVMEFVWTELLPKPIVPFTFLRITRDALEISKHYRNLNGYEGDSLAEIWNSVGKLHPPVWSSPSTPFSIYGFIALRTPLLSLSTGLSSMMRFSDLLATSFSCT